MVVRCGLLAALLLAAGCGAGSTASAGNGPAKLKVVIGPAGFEQVYIAKQQGYFSRQRLTVDIAQGGTADAQIPQLLNGQAQIAMTGGVAMVNAASKKLPVKITLGSLNATPPVTSGLVVAEGSPIRSTADLAGKKVGLSGLKDTTQLSTMLSAEAHGVDPKTITFVEMPLPSMAQALQKGTVAAVYPIGPFFRVGKGTGMRLVESPVNRYLSNGPNVVFAASDKYIAKNASVIKRFNTAIGQAVAYANAHPEAVRAVDAQYTKQPAAYTKTRPLPPLVTKINKSAVQNTVNAMAKYGFIAKKPAVGAILSSSCPTS